MSAPPLAARIAELADLLDGTGITTLTLSEGGDTVTLRRAAGPGSARSGDEPAAAAAAAVAVAGLAVTAPCPGLFLSSHPLREEPLVVPGQTVAAGTVLGLLRAGPLLLEVAAPRSGTVLAMDVADGALVGYGSVLFRLSPEAGES